MRDAVLGREIGSDRRGEPMSGLGIRQDEKQVGWRVRRFTPLALVAIAAVAGCASPASTSSAKHLPPSAAPQTTTTSTAAPTTPTTLDAPSQAVLGVAQPAPSGIPVPDHSLTPGAVFSGVTKDQVCVSGYSASVRSVSSSEKAEVYAEYHTADTPGMYEVDHLISLELGGSNDIRNLWPEPYNGTYGAHAKDTVENKLHSMVCAGQISLTDAQAAIATHWWTYLDTPPGAAPATSAPVQSPPATSPPATSAPSSGPPPGATAKCNDGTYSYSATHQGSCSHHGGVAQFYS